VSGFGRDVLVEVYLDREPNVIWTIGDRLLSGSDLMIKAGDVTGSTSLTLSCREDHHIVGTLTDDDGTPNDPDSQVGFKDSFGIHWANIHAVAAEMISNTDHGQLFSSLNTSPRFV
jgi:hypothetical protein